MHNFGRSILLALTVIVASGFCGVVLAAEVYRPITPTMADKTITATGHDLSIDQLVQIARYGARVQLSPELRQGAADSFGLVLQAQAEGVPVYLFN